MIYIYSYFGADPKENILKKLTNKVSSFLAVGRPDADKYLQIVAKCTNIGCKEGVRGTSLSKL